MSTLTAGELRQHLDALFEIEQQDEQAAFWIVSSVAMLIYCPHLELRHLLDVLRQSMPETVRAYEEEQGCSLETKPVPADLSEHPAIRHARTLFAQLERRGSVGGKLLVSFVARLAAKHPRIQMKRLMKLLREGMPDTYRDYVDYVRTT